ncbi:MocR-like pyridoxine biosynthesis transcription factor PdxR [Spongorhabdus nitratireducens]
MNPKRMPLAEIRDITLQPDQQVPLFQQLYETFRQRILDGQMRGGLRLPSSRTLAKQLGIGRNTVLAAYDQLTAEGYLQSQPGSGMFVAAELPENWHLAPAACKSKKTAEPALQLSGHLSDYASQLQQQSISSHQGNQCFCVGMPDLNAFPAKVWNRLAQQTPAAGFQHLMGFSDITGYLPLREAVADYLRTSRAVKCEVNQIVITTGAQQALDLCARVLLNPGDDAVIEDPGYMGARKALQAADARIHPCPVDQHGMQIDVLQQMSQSPKLVYVTPANQYPLGSVLSLERRMQLLDWAQKKQCWVVEDDYDSEYHYAHRPLASLQGLARHQQVIYIGSFSKVLFPSLRLGYLVLPESLVDTFIKAKSEHSGETPLHSQAVTASFMQEGHFSRHLKRMRLSYSEKMTTILAACESLKPWCSVCSGGAGMHIVLEFAAWLPEKKIFDELQKNRILSSQLSSYFVGTDKKQGLVLGFANSTPEQIKTGIAGIKKVLSRYSHQA